MLLREGADRNDQLDTSLAMSLALVAGAVNAAAFYAAGFFAANMTGNLSAASDYLVLGEWTDLLFYLALLVAFVLGAGVSAVLITAGRRRNAGRVYGYVLLGEAASLMGLGGFASNVPVEHRSALIILCLAFLMGLQNAVSTRISSARVRTTHVSGMATDLGIEIAGLWSARRGHSSAADGARNRRLLRLHLATVLAFFGGGVGGVLVYRGIGNAALVLIGAFLAAIAWLGMAGTPGARGRPSDSSDQD